MDGSAHKESETVGIGPVAQMISEGGAVSEVGFNRGARDETNPKASNPAPTASTPDSTDGTDQTRERPWSPELLWSPQLNRFWTKLAHRALEGLNGSSLPVPPDAFSKALRRTQLAQDLLSDFKQGTYSQVSKRSIALMGSGLALASKWGRPPAKVVPQLACACLSMLVTELSAEELRRYCRFKNYEMHRYFN